MRKFLKKILGITYIVCFLISMFNIEQVQAESKTLGDLKNELAKFKEDYENNRLQKEMDKQEQEKIEEQIVLTTREMDDIRNEIVNINEKIKLLETDIENKEKEITNILTLTQISNGESAYMEYIFGAKDFTDFIYRAAISEQLTSYNNNLVDSYKKDIEENNKQKNLLNERTVVLKQKQKDLDKEYDKFNVSIALLDKDVLSIEEQIKAKESEIKVYVDKGCKDNEPIDHCGNDVIPTDTVFYRPLKVAHLTSWFGGRDCSDPRVTCNHWGIDMTVNRSDLGDEYMAHYGHVPVYPIANGVVVYIVEPVKGSDGRYQTLRGGRKVYIQHNVNGQIYTSGYLHLRRIDVKVGDTVTKETQIGLVGGENDVEYYDNGSTRAHLHLEISTGTFAKGTYYSNRFNPKLVISFPNVTYGNDWTDRSSKL